MNAWFYLSIRAALWFGAVAVSLLPVLVNEHVDLDLNIKESLISINGAKVFRDVFYVLVPVAVLSLSTILDDLCKGFKDYSGTAFALTILALLFNMLSLCIGLVGFMKLPRESAIALNQLWTYSWLIGLGLMVSAGTEIGVSLKAK